MQALARSFGCGVVAASLLAVGVGCQPQPAPPPSAPINQVTYGGGGGYNNGGGGNVVAQPSSPLGGQMSADQAVNSDPTAERMQDIEGLLLQYYAIDRHLPNSLTELKPLEDPDAPPDMFVSPATHAPFMYVPAGLGTASSSKRMILYESVSHGGVRWCILMPPLGGGHPDSLSMEVMVLPDSVFAQFSPRR